LRLWKGKVRLWQLSCGEAEELQTIVQATRELETDGSRVDWTYIEFIREVVKESSGSAQGRERVSYLWYEEKRFVCCVCGGRL
jgi:hypothetical protein